MKMSYSLKFHPARPRGLYGKAFSWPPSVLAGDMEDRKVENGVPIG
jgi:hypothetical protein